MMLTEQFNTPETFVRRIKAGREAWQWTDSRDRPDFYGASSVNAALKLFHDGWPEQAQRMSKREDQIFAQLSAGVERFDPQHVECDGQMIDVAAFVANEPEHWVKFEPSIVDGQSNRILKIGFNISASYSFDKQTIINRGTIASSLLEALEYRGYRCEAWICNSVMGDRDDDWYIWKMLAKAPEQPLDLARLLFWTSHPAMIRRLGFAMMASCKDPRRFGATKDTGYFGKHHDPKDTSEYDVYVPALNSYCPINWDSEEGRNIWLKEQIEKIETQRQ